MPELVTITALQPLYEAQPPTPDSPAMKKLEESLNVKFDIRWVPTGTYTEVFNTTLASQKVPNVISAPTSLTVNPGFMAYCNAGVFHDLTNEIAERTVFKEIGVIDEISLKASAINGRNYYFPLIMQANRVSVVYREDWREAVGAPIPDTLDNFYAMAKMFTENDPDGNGMDDTYGFAYIDDGDKELAYAGFNTIAVAKGTPNQWGRKSDGSFIAYFETQEYLDTLRLFKDLYDNGYMNDDFYLIKGNDKYSPLIAGKAGMMLTSSNNAASPGGKYDALLNDNPNAKIAYSNLFTMPDGTRTTNSVIGVGAIGGPMLPTNSNTPEQVDFYMDLVAKVKSTKELDLLLLFGVEGIHYSVENGQISTTPEQIKLRKEDGSTDAFASLFPKRVIDNYGQKFTPAQLTVVETIKDNGLAVPDESVGIMDGDTLAKSVDIANIISDARVQYIIGAIGDEEFAAKVLEWKNAGGQDIIDKLNSAAS
jgi:putative aldouronate transport system substrate-binding protein